MSNYILTIGIPTWNRFPYLKENLEAIFREVVKLPDIRIEILISDNASTDETQTYCESLAKQYSFVTYLRNKENLGANKNFQQVMQNAQGDYIWLMGDDDQIVENSLEKIFADINSYHQPEIVIGGCINDETKKRLYPPFIQQPLLADKNIFAQYDGIRLAGKISVLIFKRTTFLPVLKICEPIIEYLKTPWPHLSWLMVLLNRGAKILFLPYATNYFLERNRCNMLQDGISRINITVREYAALIYYLNKSHLLTADFYTLLVRSITHNRQEEFLKVMGYTTYFNGYTPSLKDALQNLIYLRDFYNRSNFFIFYVLPLFIPIFVRKGLFTSAEILCPHWSEYNRYLRYLRATKVLFNNNNKRNIFDKSGL